MRGIIPFVSLCSLIWQTHAWGAVGHEIVATIAEMYLFDSTREAICDILSSSKFNEEDIDIFNNGEINSTDIEKPSSCHLAKVAAWADQVKGRMRWSSALHYVNGIGDHPPSTCVFGEKGWEGKPRINVLSAIQNTTEWLVENKPGSDEALKFLVHFMGDMHMPLHLTGRNKGGNGDRVKWQGRSTNFHSVWDSRIISELILLTPRKYDRPLPNAPSIESRLRGSIYDPFIRQIMIEGVYGQWSEDIESWISCPDTISSLQLSNTEQRPLLPDSLEHYSTPILETDNSLACPYHWAKPIHDLHCQFIWPPSIANENHKTVEIYTPEYMNILRKDKTLERMLSMGGLRLAAILNGVYATEGEPSSRKGVIPHV
ncbi:hypothetical protein Clacol_005381 [Clathrus columnatus]|uniref:S1/P1 nuclease n=1 Tax=Clathrus columnatus TaxID=1419009 RepID=A0AAV5AE10_9AGAM|nr:hypothetical protein Clacol_005381 [Clathrus columnatus]